jgi:hypothetical protein
MKTLQIIFTQLPDIDKYVNLPKQYDDYGRFGLRDNGMFYYLGLMSCHMPNTKIGGYWACDKKENILYLSPRNTGLDKEFVNFYNEILENGRIKLIIARSGLRA